MYAVALGQPTIISFVNGFYIFNLLTSLISWILKCANFEYLTICS